MIGNGLFFCENTVVLIYCVNDIKDWLHFPRLNSEVWRLVQVINSFEFIYPQIIGGNQEQRIRAGTENCHGILGLGKSIEWLSENMQREHERLKLLQSQLIKELKSRFKSIIIMGEDSPKLVNTLSISFPEFLGEELMMNLDLEGIEVSTGSVR